MTDENDYSHLRELEWNNIQRVNFIIKYKFFDAGYSILVSNLKGIYGENVDENEVQRRFCDLNVHAKMKTNVILRNLERSLDMALAGNDSILKLECCEKSVKIQVQFNVNRASLRFDFELTFLSLHQLRSHILVPVLSHALLTYQENVALKKKLGQLDSKLKLESVSKDSLLDFKKSSNAFNLMSNTNVSESIILDSFLNIQRDIQACSSDRKKVIDLQRNHLSEISDKPRTPTKKEISESSLPIQYDEDKVEDVKDDSSLNVLQLPVKREISESSSQSPNGERNTTQNCNQVPSPSKLERTKKKKSFKF